jgi:hypothetical protein
MTLFKLRDVLTELKCLFKRSDLHNAGYDATYTLHAMLMLAIRSSKGRELYSRGDGESRATTNCSLRRAE